MIFYITFFNIIANNSIIKWAVLHKYKNNTSIRTFVYNCSQINLYNMDIGYIIIISTFKSCLKKKKNIFLHKCDN